MYFIITLYDWEAVALSTKVYYFRKSAHFEKANIIIFIALVILENFGHLF